MTLTPALPVLTFHALDDQKAVISFSPRLFQRGIAHLHANGYRTINLAHAAERVRTRTLFPAHSLVITFDDGFKSVYDEAFPILRQYDMTATVFLTVGREGESLDRLPSLNGRLTLSWDEIREMQRGGFTFGAHTLTHPDLTRLPPAMKEAEICDSKAIIEDALNAPVTSFAFPYGRSDARSRAIVQKQFACACSDNLGLVSSASDPYALERIDMYYLRGDRLFALLQTGLFPWYLLSRGLPRLIRRTIQYRGLR